MWLRPATNILRFAIERKARGYGDVASGEGEKRERETDGREKEGRRKKTDRWGLEERVAIDRWTRRGEEAWALRRSA